MRDAQEGVRMPEGQAGLCTESNCDHCGRRFTPKNRNGLKVRFCQAKCSRDWHNAQRLKGAALLKVKSTPVQRRVNPGKQRVDLAVIPEAERPALLLEAARRLGLTEGDVLRAARQAARLSVPQETPCA